MEAARRGRLVADIYDVNQAREGLPVRLRFTDAITVIALAETVDSFRVLLQILEEDHPDRYNYSALDPKIAWDQNWTIGDMWDVLKKED